MPFGILKIYRQLIVIIIYLVTKIYCGHNPQTVARSHQLSTNLPTLANTTYHELPMFSAASCDDCDSRRKAVLCKGVVLVQVLEMFQSRPFCRDDVQS